MAERNLAMSRRGRARPRVQGGLAAVSVVAFFVAIGGWVGSYARPVVPVGVDMGEVDGRYVWEGALFMSDRGVVGVGWEYLLEKTEGATDRHTEFEMLLFRTTLLPPEASGMRPGWMGFNVVYDRGDDDIAAWSAWWVSCPYWFVVLATCAWPVWWGRGWWRRRRSLRWRREGRCGACGYDLRGSGGRCSECGEIAGKTCPPAARG